MLILEATISVLIISGVLITVYSQQTRRGISPAEYYDSLQGQILAEVSARSDLRLNVLNVVDDSDPSDSNLIPLNLFIKDKIPEGFGYSIRVCELGNPVIPCKMDDVTFIGTMDKDIYVEEIIIGAELGVGPDAVYNPKKLRLFVWEGENVPGACIPECPAVGEVLSCIGGNVWKGMCGVDTGGCLVWDVWPVLHETCTGACVNGVCTGGTPSPDTFWVDNLKADIWFAAQGAGGGGRMPDIYVNDVKVDETMGLGDPLTRTNYPLREGLNNVTLHSNWGSEYHEECGESPLWDAVSAVLRIDNNPNYIIQTDGSWDALTWDAGAGKNEWGGSPVNVYSDPNGGGCYMGVPPGILTGSSLSSDESCINSRCCANCCETNVRKQFWVHECIYSYPARDTYCDGVSFPQTAQHSDCGSKSVTGTKICGDGYDCINRVCVPETCDPDCEGIECGESSNCPGIDCPFTCDPEYKCEDNLCVPGTCVQDCEGKECGYGGCSGQNCGECTLPDTCNEDGQCECVKECMGKVCGPSNCPGQNCGECTLPETCNDYGQCECIPNCQYPDECAESAPDSCGIACTRPSRDGFSCNEGSGVCWAGSCCVQDCQYPDECVESASNGCGGTCLRNTDGFSCDEGAGTCTNGVCVEKVAELSATITMMTTATLWDSNYGCYYNKCIYQVSASNSGDVSGVVWKRVVSGDGSFVEIYNQVVNPGATIDLGQKWVASECNVDLFYSVNIYDDSGNIIGGKSFTCSHP